jgi:hypothetical protein
MLHVAHDEQQLQRDAAEGEMKSRKRVHAQTRSCTTCDNDILQLSHNIQGCHMSYETHPESNLSLFETNSTEWPAKKL